MPVYFIRAGEDGPVKIGKSVDAESRLRALQTSHYETLILMRVVKGDCLVESWYHKKYEDKRIRGEWFSFDESMLHSEYVPQTDEPLINADSTTDQMKFCVGTSRLFVRSSGYSQKKMAEHFDVSEGTLSKWLSGKCPIPMKAVIPLAQFMGVSVDQIVETYAETRK